MLVNNHIAIALWKRKAKAFEGGIIGIETVFWGREMDVGSIAKDNLINIAPFEAEKYGIAGEGFSRSFGFAVVSGDVCGV